MERNTNFLAYAYPIPRLLILICLFMSSTIASLAFFIPDALCDTPPPVYAVDITDYEDTLSQHAGTTKTYEVTVKNTGVMAMSEIRLGVERIDLGWFSSTETVALEFGETAVLAYELAIPEGTEGFRAFSLVVFGTSGSTTVSNTKIVSLDITPADASSDEPSDTTTITLPTATTDGIDKADYARPPFSSILDKAKIPLFLTAVILILFLVKNFS